MHGKIVLHLLGLVAVASSQYTLTDYAVLGPRVVVDYAAAINHELACFENATKCTYFFPFPPVLKYPNQTYEVLLDLEVRSCSTWYEDALPHQRNETVVIRNSVWPIAVHLGQCITIRRGVAKLTAQGQSNFQAQPWTKLNFTLINFSQQWQGFSANFQAVNEKEYIILSPCAVVWANHVQRNFKNGCLTFVANVSILSAHSLALEWTPQLINAWYRLRRVNNTYTPKPPTKFYYEKLLTTAMESSSLENLTSFNETQIYSKAVFSCNKEYGLWIYNTAIISIVYNDKQFLYTDTASPILFHYETLAPQSRNLTLFVLSPAGKEFFVRRWFPDEPAYPATFQRVKGLV